MRQIMPIAGAVVGGIFGAPQLGFAIGSMIGNIVDPIEIQGRKLGDAPTQVAAEGGARAIVFGKGCVRAVVLMERGGRTVKKQRARGGKGGPKQEGDERAFWTYAIGICEAIPGGGLLRIWENEKLVYDVTPASTIPEDTAEFAKLFRFYDGSESQLPDPAIEAIYTDPTDAPYYRGTAYMVFPQRDLTDFGEAVPTYRVEVAAAVESQSMAMIAFRRYGVSGQAMVLGADYSGSWVQHDALTNIFGHAMSVGERVLTTGAGSVVPARTDDRGASFVGGSGAIGVYSPGPGWSVGDVVLLPGVLGEINRSTDRGATWAPIGGSPRSSVIVAIGARWVLANHYSEGIRYSDSPIGDGWSSDVSTALSPRCGWANDSVAYFGGASHPANDRKLIRTHNGFDFDVEAYPPELGTGEQIISMWGHGNIVVAGTDTGKIIRRSPLGVWSYVHDFGTSNVTEIKHNGVEFVAIGGSGASDTHGKIKSSVDGIAWVERISSPLIYHEDWTAIATLPYEHIEAGQPVPLSTVVAALHDRCGHAPSDYDVTAIPDPIDGVVIESTQTAAEAINSLIGTHWADPADYDGKIRYIKRGAPVVRTLTIDDLIDEPETWQRNNAIEYPAKMHFFGQIADLAYASVKATSARYSADVKVVGEVSVSSPETFNTSQRPYEIAAILHKIMWTEAGGEVTWRVTDQHLDLVPTDCVGLSWAGQLWRARITQIEADPGELKLKMMLDRQSAYTANLTAIPVPPAPTPPQTGIVSDTVLAIMDLPALTDNADTLNYYAAMSGETDAWAGAVLQQSLDGGSTFTTVGETRINSIIGILQEPLPAGLEWYTDETNAVVVELYTDDDLESRSEVEFLNGGGAFALSYSHGGNRPTWEVMQFRDAEKIGPKLWKLTTIHRGQKGTLPNTHSPGDQFVLLDSSVLRLPAQVAWLWAGGAPPGETARPPLVHRAVSNGQTPDTADVVESLYLGFSQREWSTAQVMAERDGGTITASVIPRQRFGTSMNPIRSVNFEGYEWQVATTPSGDVLTTVTTGPDEPNVTMTVAWPGPVVVSCVLRNRLTGAGGFAATRFHGEPGFSAITLD